MWCPTNSITNTVRIYMNVNRCIGKIPYNMNPSDEFLIFNGTAFEKILLKVNTRMGDGCEIHQSINLSCKQIEKISKKSKYSRVWGMFIVLEIREDQALITYCERILLKLRADHEAFIQMADRLGETMLIYSRIVACLRLDL